MANIDIIKRKIFVTSNHGKAQIVDVFLKDTLYDPTSDSTACNVHYIVIDDTCVISEPYDKLEFFTYVGYFSEIYIKKLLTTDKISLN